MPQENLIRLTCQNCKRITYYTFKNRRKVERKLELKKFCRYCRKHTVQKEAKRK